MIRRLLYVCLWSNLIIGVRCSVQFHDPTDDSFSIPLKLFLENERNQLQKTTKNINYDTNHVLLSTSFEDWKNKINNQVMQSERRLETPPRIADFYRDSRIPVLIPPLILNIEDKLPNNESSTMSIASSMSNFTLFSITSTSFSVTMDATFDVVETGMEFRRSFDVGSINITITLSAPLDEGLFWHLRQQTISADGQALPCLISNNIKENPIADITVNSFSQPVIQHLPFAMQWVSFLLPASESNIDLLEQVDSTFPTVLNATLFPFIDELVSSFELEKNCEPLISTYHFLDFRDFFLSPEASVKFGGSGTEPYGNIGRLFYAAVESVIGEQGDATMINSMIPSEIETPDDIFAFNFSHSVIKDRMDVETVYFKLFHPRMNNFDVIRPPIAFVSPTEHPHILRNSFNLGPEPGRPTNAKVAMKFELKVGENSILASTTNEFDLGFQVDSLQVAADSLIRINAEQMMKFPFANIFDLPCWIALIPEKEEAFKILKFSSRVNGFTLNLRCRECNNRVFDDSIPNMLDILNATSATSIMGYRISLLLEEFMLSDTFASVADKLIMFSKKLCPHRDEYEPDSVFLLTQDENFNPLVANRSTLSRLPVFSNEAIETIVYSVTLIAHVGMVAAADIFSEIGDNLGESQGVHVVPEEKLGRYKSIRFAPEENLGESQVISVAPEGNLGNSRGAHFVPEAVDNVASIMAAESGLLPQGMGFMNDFVMSMGEESDACLPADSTRKRKLSNNQDFVIQPDLTFDLGSRNVTISQLKIVGLPSVGMKDILSPQGSDLYRSEFGLGNLELELEVKISPPSEEGKYITEQTDLMFTASLALQNLEIAVTLFFLLDKENLQGMNLGRWLTFDNIVNCLTSLVKKLEVSELFVSVGSIDSLEIRGFPTPEVARAADGFQKKFLEDFHDLLVSSIPVLVDVSLRSLLNDVIESSLKSFSNCSVVEVEHSPNGYIDFRDLLLSPNLARLHGGSGAAQYGDIIYRAMEKVYEQLELDDKGFAKVNELLRKKCSTGRTPYYNVSFQLEGEVFSFSEQINEDGINAAMELKVSNVGFENLDTIGAPLKVLNVTRDSPHQLNNAFAIGINEKPLIFKLNFFLHLLVGEDSLPSQNDFDISAYLYSPTGIFDGVMRIEEKKIMEFPMIDITNVNCLLAMIPVQSLDKYGNRLYDPDPDIVIKRISMFLHRLDMRLYCRNCTSPHLIELSDILNQGYASLYLTEMTNRGLKLISSILQDGLILDQISQLAHKSARKCPHSPEYESDVSRLEDLEQKSRKSYSSSFKDLILFAFAIIMFVVIVGIYAIVNRLLARRRQHTWLSNLSHAQYKYKKEMEQEEDMMMKNIDETGKSLFCSPVIPLIARYSIPIVILGNIAFFLSGHLSLGGIGKAKIDFAGESFTVDGMNEMSIGDSTLDLWHMGSRSAATFIFCFSVVWPYIKQMVSLVLWYIPPRICPSARRESIYLWLDTLAKWSMVDVMLMVINLAGLRISFSSPHHEILPDNFYNIDIWALPLWGLYANMIAQLISQFSSHFIIYYHRLVVETEIKAYKRKQIISQITSATEDDSYSDIPDASLPCSHGVYGSSKDQLCKHEFNIPQKIGSAVASSRYVDALIIVGAISFFVLIVASCICHSISFETLGLVGLVHELSLNGANSIDNFSVIGFARMLSNQAGFLNTAKAYVGMNSINAVLVLTVLVVPILQMLTLIYLWFVPLTGTVRKKILVLLECIVAWEYSEVYILALMVQAWQFEDLSNYLMNPYCETFEPIFQLLVQFDVLSESDGQCYLRRTRIEIGGYLMAFAVTILYLINSFVTKAAMQYFRQRDRCDYVPPDHQLSSLVSVGEEEEPEERVIRPFPALFTDIYGFVLRDSNTKATMLDGTYGQVGCGYDICKTEICEQDKKDNSE